MVPELCRRTAEESKIYVTGPPDRVLTITDIQKDMKILYKVTIDVQAILCENNNSVMLI